MDFILATNNMKKLAEMQRILSPLGNNVVTAKMLGITLRDVEENGNTFEENAEIKATAACKETGMPSIADDSGLCVDYLDGAPGIFSAVFRAVTAMMSAITICCLKSCRAFPWRSAALTTSAQSAARFRAEKKSSFAASATVPSALSATVTRASATTHCSL